MDNYLLEAHRIMAQRISKDPLLLEFPRKQLSKWSSNDLSWSSTQALEEWQELIDHSTMEELIYQMTRADDEGQRLRSSSPFGSGILSASERNLLLEGSPDNFQNRRHRV
jgi:hypothetical protein